MPIHHQGMSAKLCAYAIYVSICIIVVQLWFSYDLDGFVSGSEPAEGMSRAFLKLIFIAVGLISLSIGAATPFFKNLAVRSTLLVALISLMIFTAILP
ncbi:hypothetical protein [Sphingomonas sp. CFBP 13706]|uniref:hypothetical protein n=1 Tax=Sphingomonas sp. CFBP 13706 TaxID=2775314 RepID=UPI001782E643|nr:hypothetical protein [Sphingomonas sp. CFBP 13706]MBD8736805.1 hypothetical protein [Sphingomonas sp. CFBP 13706]